MQIDQQLIEKLSTLKPPAIIAISGFGGAGKSTTAHKLATILHAPVVCVDQFGIDRIIEDYTHWKGMDFERLEKETLIPFSKGENSGTIIIIEGVGLFRPELLKYFSYKIWVDCPQDIAMARGKKRDREVNKNPQDEKWDGAWKRNDEEYFNTYKPKDLADFIISNC